jgi:hypothetical protein
VSVIGIIRRLLFRLDSSCADAQLTYIHSPSWHTCASFLEAHTATLASLLPEFAPRSFSFSDRLEAEDLVLELADRPGLGETQTLSCLLHSSDHRRGAADQDLDVAGGRRELLLDHIGGDEANATVPTLRRVVQDIVYAELGVLGCERIEIVLEQDILGVDVREDEVDLGLIAGGAASVDCLHDLQHRCDAGAACDHTEVPDHVGCVDHCALGALDLHLVADLEVCDILRDVAGGVGLDQEIEEALVVVGGGGSVRTDDLLGLAFDVGGEGDMLTDGETEDVALFRELETVAMHVSCCSGSGRHASLHGSVVRKDSLLPKLKFLERIRFQYLTAAACSCQLLRNESGYLSNLLWLLKTTAPIRMATRARA